MSKMRRAESLVKKRDMTLWKSAFKRRRNEPKNSVRLSSNNAWHTVNKPGVRRKHVAESTPKRRA